MQEKNKGKKDRSKVGRKVGKDEERKGKGDVSAGVLMSPARASKAKGRGEREEEGGQAGEWRRRM